MLIQFDDGRELQICQGSFVFQKHKTGGVSTEETYREWQDLKAEEQQKFEVLVRMLSKFSSN